MKLHSCLLILMFSSFITRGFTQQLNQKTVDEKRHYEILTGKCNREGFATCNFDSAYNAGYSAYTPDMEILSRISSDLGDVSITLVMGTWCGDSKEQVPHFYKILDKLNFDYSKFTLICVDRDKKAQGLDLSALKIEKVPTFIFYRNNIEAGRIIETPEASLEKDLLRIIAKN
jgi:hypothetical protein